MKRIIAIIAILAILLTACAQEPQREQQLAPAMESSPQETAPEPAPQETLATPSSDIVDVTIENFAFNPPIITVKTGTTVRWTNKDKVRHNAQGDSFKTELLKQGESGQHTFESAGTFNYICGPHPNMKGKVIVE